MDSMCALSSDERYWITFWTLVAMVIVLVAAIVTAGVCYHRKTMAENGYEEVTLPGSGAVCWQKIRPVCDIQE